MDYIIVILALIFGFSLKSRYSKLGAKEHIILDQLFFYHMVMSFIFYIYVSFNVGDATTYWSRPKILNFDDLIHKIISGNAGASEYIYIINYIPSNLLDLSFFTGSILYGVLGYWGIIYLTLTLKELFPLINHVDKIKFLNISIYPGILFLPNFHFWSSSVGKDTLLFFCVCLFFYSVNKLKLRWPLLLIVFSIAIPIRPHILLFLLTGYGVSFILKSKLFIFQKLFLILFSFLLLLPLLQSALELANMEEASLDSFNEFSQSKAKVLAGSSGSAVDIGSLPYPLQVLTFLYRPLFFDAHNIFSLFASIENVIWLILTLIFISNKPIKVMKNGNMLIMSAFLFWLIGALAFAPVLGNLGIIIRERNMFLPGFIIFAVAGLYHTKKFRKFEWFYYQKQKEFFNLKSNDKGESNEP